MEEPNTKQNYEKPYKMDPNVEAALSYIPLVGVAVFVMEKSNKFVKFHAMQAILFWLGVLVLNSVANFLKLIVIGYVLIPIVSLASVAGWVFLSWKAYNNEEYEFPLIGKIAREQANK